jgi:hypothetical protein
MKTRGLARERAYSIRAEPRRKRPHDARMPRPLDCGGSIAGRRQTHTIINFARSLIATASLR